MTLLPHHIAGILLLGGLSVGGYFTVSALTPPTLENRLKELGLEILTSKWEEKENEYNNENAETIDSIPKVAKGAKIDGFAGKLEKWCNKRKTKSFFGEEDQNYKRFSLWCTVNSKIQDILSKRNGLIAITKDESGDKFKAYNAAIDADKFTGEKSQDLISLCNIKKGVKYKYESDPEFKKVIKWCYEKA